jgi:hypothetical protein
MTVKNGTSAAFEPRAAELLENVTENRNWLGVRDALWNWLLTAA